jgi:uncharacterized protein involved in exopolysaccharide biosynthesis
VNTTTQYVSEEEITLRDVTADIFSRRYYILAAMLVLGSGGLALGLIKTKEYQSQIVVAPVSADSGHSGGLGALASQYGDLASLAGVSSPGASKKNESVAVLQSELLTETYITQQNLLPVLRNESWITRVRRWMGYEPKPLTLWQANQLFKKSVRTVRDDKLTGLIYLTITWKDPVVAAKWANDIVNLTNSYLRDKAIREAERNIGYLNEQAAKTNILEARQAVFALLKDELNNEMLAKGREDYALKVIDPAFAPEKPSSFGGLVLAIFGLIIGFVLSILAILAKRVFGNALAPR